MYVLCSPCILEPQLRAEGITRPSDLELFARAQDRCRKFAIEMIPLPCPETLYLGAGRQPGTFIERLNTPAFSSLMDTLEDQVKGIIDSRGLPIGLVGVNSSPTCGVTSTYYGSEGDSSPKRSGRGVFLSRFPGFRVLDVTTFSRYRVYLAAPLFSEAERSFNVMVAKRLEENLFEVHLPQDAGDDSDARVESEQHRIFRINLQELRDADIVVAIIDGADADSGTAWEMGFASALGKPVVALRTDFRRVGHHEHVNLMLEQSATVVTTTDQLLSALNAPLLSGPDA
jgi:nucleoside 2-deoxyribosyltransferase/predicted secreted protein